MKWAVLFGFAGICLLCFGASRIYAQSTDGYCVPHKVRNFLGLTHSFPSVSPIPANGELPFGPSNLEVSGLNGLIENQRLIEGSTTFGFTLSLSRGRSAVRLGWLIEGRLFPLRPNGTTKHEIGMVRRRVSGIRILHDRSVAITIPETLGFYLVKWIVHGSDHNKLGEFSEYVRVMPSIFAPRLGLEKVGYVRGETVRSRLENLGTEDVIFEAPFRVEQLINSEWIRVGPTQTRWPRYLAGLHPGYSGPCMEFTIPRNFEAGTYRISKDVKEGEEGSGAQSEVYAVWTVS